MATDQLAGHGDVQIYTTYESVLLGVVIWDWLVCLRSEYQHVWTAKRSVVQVLYIMSRYISLILTSLVFTLNYLDQPLSTCNVLVRFNCAAITLVQAISLSVLTHRAYYVSLRSKPVLLLLALFIVALVTCGVVHAVVAVESSPSATVDGHGVCRVQARPHWKALSTAFFALPVVGHAVATAVVLFHTRRHLPHNGNLRRLLVLDGVLYLVAVDAVGLVHLIFFAASSDGRLAMMNAAALLSLTSVFCCRFILHLRSKANEVSVAGTRVRDWAQRPDWTNNFGAPLSTSKTVPSLKEVFRPKHRLSRLSDTGIVTIESLPELRAHYLPREDHIVEFSEVEIRQDTIQKIDTMSISSSSVHGK